MIHKLIAQEANGTAGEASDKIINDLIDNPPDEDSPVIVHHPDTGITIQIDRVDNTKGDEE